MSSWQRQYDTPTIQGLLDELSVDQRGALNILRKWLTGHLRARGTLSYVDVAWHWCEQYTVEDSDVGDLRVVYLIPDPAGARVAVCFARRYFETLSAAAVPKGLHAGLSEGVCVGHLAWCEWPIVSPEDAKALIELLGQMRGE